MTVLALAAAAAGTAGTALAAARPPPPADLGLPARVGPAPSPAQAALGRKLFFDRRLSFNGTLSCAMCHVPEQGFASTASKTAIGLEGRVLPRNAPTLLNVAWLPRFFQDGRETSLQTQIWSPLLDANEMANPSAGYVLEKLRTLPDYAGRFQSAFGAEADMATLGRALEAFESSLTAADAPFDRWRYGREVAALSDSQKAGFYVFVGKGRCASCHLVGPNSALFTDHLYHATGVSRLQPTNALLPVALSKDAVTYLTDVELASFVSERKLDLGRYEITMDPADRFAFRTPSLRNVERTSPYMHDGSLPTLDSVIEFYDRGGGEVPNQSTLLVPLHLTAPEKVDLIGFLRSLTSPAADSLPETVRRGDD